MLGFSHVLSSVKHWLTIRSQLRAKDNKMSKEILFLLLLINMTMSAPAQLEEQLEGMIEKLFNFQMEVQIKLDEIQNLNTFVSLRRREETGRRDCGNQETPTRY